MRDGAAIRSSACVSRTSRTLRKRTTWRRCADAAACGATNFNSSTRSCCLWICYWGPGNTAPMLKRHFHHEGHEEREGFGTRNTDREVLSGVDEASTGHDEKTLLTEALRHRVVKVFCSVSWCLREQPAFSSARPSVLVQARTGHQTMAADVSGLRQGMKLSKCTRRCARSILVRFEDSTTPYKRRNA